jgi:hypothetical protein
MGMGLQTRLPPLLLAQRELERALGAAVRLRVQFAGPGLTAYIIQAG